MTVALLGWAVAAMLVLAFMTSRPRTFEHPHEERQLTKCPLCKRWMVPFEFADFDGINIHCDICRGFMGIRPLGSEPGSETLMRYEKDRT